MSDKPKPGEIKVAFPEHLQAGVYANNMSVAHNEEEFIMDFFVVAPVAGAVTARVIISPGNMKRILTALQDNVKKYEASFGKIKEAPEQKAPVAFH